MAAITLLQSETDVPYRKESGVVSKLSLAWCGLKVSQVRLFGSLLASFKSSKECNLPEPPTSSVRSINGHFHCRGVCVGGYGVILSVWLYVCLFVVCFSLSVCWISGWPLPREGSASARYADAGALAGQIDPGMGKRREGPCNFSFLVAFSLHFGTLNC